MEQNKHKGISYRLEPSEFFFLVFGRKKCPKCGSKLIKQKKSRTVKGGVLNRKTDPVFAPGADVKSYYYEFSCPNCRTQYSLQELASKNTKN